MRHTRRAVLAGLAASVSLVRKAAAETYPNRPVRIISPYSPGGGADILARVLGEQLKNEFGQPFVTDNKPGAAGIIAIEEVARAKPDGHTLMLGNVTTNTITPILFAKKLSVDYDRGIVPVARLAEYPAFLLAANDFAPRSFADMLAFARENPGKVRYGTPGVGSYTHFDTVRLARAAKVDLVHIPNKGGGAAVLKDVLTGDAQIGIVNVVSAAPMLKTGQVRALALIYDHRLPEFPDVPTLTELGYPGIGTISRLGLFTTGGTPNETLDALATAINKVLAAEPMKETFAKNGMNANPTADAAAAKAWLAEDMASWRSIIAEVNIDMEGN
ncbi:MAG: tripartite tricarboxylate transporter substrate binding protein [Rhizobiales bacterium]|nr:tripartite tricarboxylate transporter substrate binding protein [Hyphomicrobiales bacterium]